MILHFDTRHSQHAGVFNEYYMCVVGVCLVCWCCAENPSAVGFRFPLHYDVRYCSDIVAHNSSLLLCALSSRPPRVCCLLGPFNCDCDPLAAVVCTTRCALPLLDACCFNFTRIIIHNVFSIHSILPSSSIGFANALASYMRVHYASDCSVCSQDKKGIVIILWS